MSKHLLLLLVLLQCFSRANDTSSRSNPTDLLLRAHRSVETAKPFKVRASFIITGLPHGPVRGTLVRVWVNENHWREEITTGGIRQVTTYGEHKFWRERNAFIPNPVILVSELMKGEMILRSEASSDYEPKGTASFDGRVAQCVETKGRFKQKICFDEETGAVIRRQTNDGRKEYADFRRIADFAFPWRMKSATDRQPGVQINVEQITDLAQAEQDFSASSNAEEWPVCDGKLEPPKPTYDPEPSFPEGARQLRQQGSMLLNIAIEENGTVGNAEVTDPLAPAFDAAAVERVLTWKFKPATCDRKPMKTEVTVEVNFHLY